MTLRLPIGYVPLLDAAPLIVAAHLGFDLEEGLRLDLRPAPSWSRLRDMLVFGEVSAAHMLAPVPIASALGLGGVTVPLSTLQLLSVNGNVIGVGLRLAQRLTDQGHGFQFNDAFAAGASLAMAATAPLRIGVPFPFSTHAELLHYWLEASGLNAKLAVEVKTVAPALMADALASDEIDAFCVGEPWGSRAVELGIGALLLPGRAIWSFAPEKVLAARSDWIQENPDLTARLMRAVWKANRWLGRAEAKTTLAELMARATYLDTTSELLDRALSGEFVINPLGDTRRVARFIEFYDGAATFPWKSQASWFADRLAARLRLRVRRVEAQTIAESVFRSDLYRANLAEAGAVLPTASSKLEGANADQVGVASWGGRLFLAENRFLDGEIFDPGIGI